MRCAIVSIPKCVVLVNEELHALADFLSFLLGTYCRAVQCSIVREGLLHLPQVCLPETPAVLRILLAVASGSCSRGSRCLDELLEVAAYDSRKGVVETPELTELDFRFLFLLSEHRSLCLSSAKIGCFNAEIWQFLIIHKEQIPPEGELHLCMI